MRVVIVTLDSHLSRVVSRARDILRRDIPGLAMSLHAAADWETNPAALERCKSEIAVADIVIANMLFLEDQLRALIPTLIARREACDAMVVTMSAGEAVKLTKLGGFRMDAPSRGPLALLKKLRGTKEKNASSGAGQMAMLRRLPKILRFIPGKAQDVRAYFLTMQYWLSGSEENIVSMVRLLVDRYASGPRAVFKGRTKALPPVDYPEVGLYHRSLPRRFGERIDALPKLKDAKGRVGVLIHRSYVLAGDTGHYDGVIEALEARGLQPIVAFASGLDQRPAIPILVDPAAHHAVKVQPRARPGEILVVPEHHPGHEDHVSLRRRNAPRLEEIQHQLLGAHELRAKGELLGVAHHPLLCLGQGDDPVLEIELALLQALDLQLVVGADRAESLDRGVEVAVLLPQPFQLRLERCAFAVSDFRRHVVRAVGAVCELKKQFRSRAAAKQRRCSCSIAPRTSDGKGVGTF